ncbi:MAG: diacylglycerol kinase [Candidatus Parcubacteria bacterium]|nr:MAG: diacylglycerol kinase [Candidatus Parcubacteria bacterium]
MNIRKIIKSFKHAFHGFKRIIREENSFQFMLLFFILLIILMFYLPTTKIEKIILLIMALLVLSFELLNTFFERLLDFIHPNYNEVVRDLKDFLAAIVLLISLMALVVGLIIFLPYFRDML